MPTQIEAPTDAREMHGRIFSSETTQLPPDLVFFLSMVLKNNVDIEAESAQPLLTELEEEIVVVREAVEEQTIARTLLLRFGLPYLPGAEEVWLTLSEYLANAKEATEQTQTQLEQTINQVQALFISQLVADEENQLLVLEAEEVEHQQGINTLGESGYFLTNEGQLTTQKNNAVTQKRERLNLIASQKITIQNSIESMRSMVNNLFMNFTNIRQFDQTQLVMA
jgi:hypothetical protein